MNEGKIDAELKAKIALEAVRQVASVVDLAHRYAVHPNPIHAWKKQLLEQASRAFEKDSGSKAEVNQNARLRSSTPRSDSSLSSPIFSQEVGTLELWRWRTLDLLIYASDDPDRWLGAVRKRTTLKLSNAACSVIGSKSVIDRARVGEQFRGTRSPAWRKYVREHDDPARRRNAIVDGPHEMTQARACRSMGVRR